MAKLNTRSAATDIAETDIFLKDNTGSTTSEKVEFPLLRSKVLKGKNWTIVPDADYSLVAGDKVTFDIFSTVSRTFTLPATFNTNDDANEIMVWNNDSLGLYDLILAPASGDQLYINGGALTVDTTWVIPRGEMVTITPRTTDSTWWVKSQPLNFKGSGESNPDYTADYVALSDASGTNRKMLMGDILSHPWFNHAGALALALGDRVFTESGGYTWTLPQYHNMATDHAGEQEIWIWNNGGSSDIVLAPFSGDSMDVNGVQGSIDDTYNIPPGALAICVSNFFDAKWAVRVLHPNIVSPKRTATLGAAATTFAATSSFMEITGDAGSNTVATITGGIEGQTLVMLFKDALVTITDTDAHTADTVDLSAAFTSAADTTLTLIYDGTSWYETSRSVN